MILLRASLFSLLLLALFSSGTGCNDGKDDNDGPGIAQNISGKNWKGSIYATDGTKRVSLTATIVQKGEAVTITTSLPSGRIGHHFTGTIYSGGKMRVTDSFDGELWSTFFGPAHGNFIKLADYEVRPTPGNGIDDFYVMELSRNGGTRPPDIVPTAPGTTVDPPKVTPPPVTPPPVTPPTPPPVTPPVTPPSTNPVPVSVTMPSP